MTIHNNNPEGEEVRLSRQRLDSTASDKTEIENKEKKLKRKTTMTKDDVLNYFTIIGDNLKCSLCLNSQKVSLTLFLIYLSRRLKK